MHHTICPRCESPQCEAYGHELLCPDCFYHQSPETERRTFNRHIEWREDVYVAAERELVQLVPYDEVAERLTDIAFGEAS